LNFLNPFCQILTENRLLEPSNKINPIGLNICDDARPYLLVAGNKPITYFCPNALHFGSQDWTNCLNPVSEFSDDVVRAPETVFSTMVKLVCVDDDAQGQPLEVIWELELEKKIIDREAWKSIGTKGFDSPKFFGAYVRTLRWGCVTATDPRLFQSPFRAGIRIDAS
jgi:hypothetical protein